MSEHTPGPWEHSPFVPGRTPYVRAVAWESDGSRITHFIADVLPRRDGSTEANARLIAAAPALLEACKAAVRGKVVNNWLTGGDDVCLVCGELPATKTHDENCWVPNATAAIAKAEGTE